MFLISGDNEKILLIAALVTQNGRPMTDVNVTADVTVDDAENGTVTHIGLTLNDRGAGLYNIYISPITPKPV